MARKLFALLLICAVLFSMFPMAVYGEEGSERTEVEPRSGELSSDPAWEQEKTTEEANSETNLQVRRDYDLSPEDTAPEPKGELKAGEQSGSCGESLQWSFVADTGELIISGSGKMTDYYSGDAPWYSLRSKIKKLTVQDGVSYLGECAFNNCTKLTEVSLPGSLQAIGGLCFQECTLLTSISLPEGLESLGYGVFNLADLGAVHLPASLTALGDYCFYGCQNLNEITVAEGNPTYSVTDGVLYNYVDHSLVLCPANRTAHLVIPNNVTRLRDEGLAHCTKLESVTIPDGMKWDDNAFTFCKGLLNVYVYETNPNYQSMEGVLYSKDGTVLVLFPAGRSGSYQVKAGTVEIGYGAFCRMENEINVSLPDSVEVIGIGAFSYSPGLRELKLPGKLREIYAHAFNGCKNMTNVELPESLTLLGYGSFEDCKSITEITIPSQITSIASDTFSSCSSLKKVELKGAVTGIYNYAFYSCGALETINFPDSLTEIYSYAFCYCRKLQAVELPEGLTYLGSYAFNSCASIPKVVIPQGVEKLYTSVFRGCNALKEVVLPRGLNSIGASALSDTAIEQLVIPETVKELGSGALRWCESLKCIHFLGDAPTIAADSFSYTAEELVLCYVEGKEGWSTPQWNEIPTQIWDYDYSTTASCTSEGEECFRCKHCTLEYVRKVQAYGHRFGEWVLGQRPTETTEGYWLWSCTVCGAEEREGIPVLSVAEQTAMTSSNAARQNYTTYARTVRSYLIENEDGTLTRVEAGEASVSVERYDQDLSFIDRRELPMELPIFGGFYEGETDYFMVFGQVNGQEEDSVEVIRVVRYSKDWLRKGQSSLYGANTYIPFDAGSLRMTQYGDMLYVLTCHEMYKSSDGYHHQANMIFGVYLPEMRITDQFTDVMNVSYGYVSHSFNQFILTDENRLLTLNHGDAYPRSAVIVEYQKPAGEQEFTGSCNYTSVMKFTGGIGYNATGASLGAFELSDTSYLTAGNSILQDGSVELGGQRNIFLGVTPRGEIGTADSTIRWITNYDNNAEMKISTPHLVKIREDHFLLLWMENDVLRYVFVNGKGVKTSQVYRAEMLLSDCKPIVYQNKICWYVTQSSHPLFCSIPLDHPEAPTMSDLEVTVTLEPNGGTLENNTLTVLWNKPYGELPVPNRKSAYKFLGWYTSPYAYGTQITADTRVTLTTEHTLYATWEWQAHECEMELSEVIPATCTTGEIEIYSCIYCDYGYSIYDYVYVHTWDEGKITIEPTCVKSGEKVMTCVLCGVTETQSVPPTGHSYTDVVTEPSCLERGYTTHICACGHEYTDSFLPALGHEWDAGRITTEPDCTTGGSSTLQCVRCTATKTESVPALGHLWNEGSVITEPTCTEGGLRSLKCHRCAATKTETIPPMGHRYMDDICTVCGEGLKNPFEDVFETDYFFKPVLWAVQRGITNGTSATRFSPAAPCTRGQIVTFLWRACGSPEPDGENNPFTDVSPSAYYYKAVIWAVENGITTGTGATTFSPEKTCTRGQVVTFLWRAQGKPTPSSDHNPFGDVDSKAYYCSAVLWAVEEEITNGTGKGKFSPDASCTRGQIVTFLYRALNDSEAK